MDGLQLAAGEQLVAAFVLALVVAGGLVEQHGPQLAYALAAGCQLVGTAIFALLVLMVRRDPALAPEAEVAHASEAAGAATLGAAADARVTG